MTVQAFTVRNNGGDYNTQSNNAYSFSDVVVNFELTTSTPFTLTIPSPSSAIYAAGGSATHFLAFFSYSKAANVFLKPDTVTTIAFPTGVQVTGNTELNTDLYGGRLVKAGQELQLLTADTGVYVTVRLYSVPAYATP
jgi:hypothetical protein